MTTFATNKCHILLLLFYALSRSCISTASEKVEEYEIKTALTLNLALFTEWPEGSFDKPDAPLELCVIGDNVVQEAFSKVSEKSVGSRSIHISDITRSRNIQNCHVVFLGNQDRIQINQIQNAAIGKPILTIDDINGLASFKSIVNIQRILDKMRLTINLKLAKQSHLKISSRVLKLANVIY